MTQHLSRTSDPNQAGELPEGYKIPDNALDEIAKGKAELDLNALDAIIEEIDPRFRQSLRLYTGK